MRRSQPQRPATWPAAVFFHMATVIGPLFSNVAYGSLAEVLVFTRGKKKISVKKWTTPSNPRSQLQVANRLLWTYVTQRWQTLPGSDEDAWNPNAIALNVTPYQAYCSENLKRWTHYTWPIFSPSDSGSNPPDLATLFITPGSRLAQWRQTVNFAHDAAGLALWIAKAPIIPFHKSQVCTIVPFTSGQLSGVIGPLKPGSYSIHSAGFTTNGTLGPFTPTQTINVS